MERTLPLPVFSLPEPEMVADDQAPHMAVTLEGGQTVELDMALAESTTGELRENVIQIAYGHFPEANRRNAEHS